MSVCLICHEPLDDSARSTVHVSGEYRCKTGEWATPMDGSSPRDIEQEAYADGYREAEHEYEDKIDDAYDEGKEEGYAEALSDLRIAVAEARIRLANRDEDPMEVLTAVERALE